MHNLKTNLKRALPKKSTNRLKCSFCGKRADAVNKLIAGPKGIYICDACIGKCNDILAQDAAGTLDLPPADPA